MLGGTPKPEPPAEAAAPAALPEGYKKDGLGRVHGPDGKIVSAEKLATLATPTPQPEAVKPEAFRFRHNGKDHDAAGFEFNPADGTVKVAAEQVGLLRDALNARQLISEGRDINAQLRKDYEAVQRQLGEKNTVDGAKAEKYNRASLTLFDRLEKAPEWFFNRISDPNLRETLVSEWQREMGYITKDVSFLLREADLKIPKVAEQSPPNEQQIAQAVQGSLTTSLDELFNGVADARSLFDDKEQGDLYESFQRRVNAYVVRDKDGNMFLDFHGLKQDFDREVTRQRRISDAAKDARTKEAERAKLLVDNARRTAPSITAPPTPAGGPTPARAPKDKPFASKKDVTEWWDSPEI